MTDYVIFIEGEEYMPKKFVVEKFTNLFRETLQQHLDNGGAMPPRYDVHNQTFIRNITVRIGD